MRVLMLVDFFPPAVGGLEQYVYNLSVALARRGHRVSVATLAQPGSPDVEEVDGVRVYRLPGLFQRLPGVFRDPTRTYTPPFPDPYLVAALRHVILTTRPELVNAHSWLVHSFLPLKAWSRARLVLTLHEYGLVDPTRVRPRAPGQAGEATILRDALGHYGVAKGIVTFVGHRLSRRPLMRAVDRFIAVSAAVARGNGLTIGERPYDVIPVPIADDLGSATSGSELSRAALPREPFMLFVGAIGAHKGVDVLLDAYRGIAGAPPLAIIGAPWPTAPRSYPPGVVVRHNWPHHDVLAAWRRCLFGIIPSIWPEPFGTVSIEAQALGRAVIVARAGGLPDTLLDGETGILVPPGDPIALRRAIVRLLDDPALARRMGEAGRAWTERFRARNVVPRIEAVYQAALGSSPSATVDT